MSLEAAKNAYNKALNTYLDQRGVDPLRLQKAGTFFEIDGRINVPDDEHHIPPGLKQLFRELYSPRNVLPYRFRFAPNYIIPSVTVVDTEHPMSAPQYWAIRSPDPEDYSAINKGIHEEMRDEMYQWTNYVAKSRSGILIPGEEIILSREPFIDLQDTPPHLSIAGNNPQDWFKDVQRHGYPRQPMDKLHMRMKALTPELLIELASIVADKPEMAEQYAKNPGNVDGEIFERFCDFGRQMVLYTKLGDENEGPSVSSF